MASYCDTIIVFEAPTEVTFRGIIMFFYCNFNTEKLLQIAMKHMQKKIITSSQKQQSIGIHVRLL